MKNIKGHTDFVSYKNYINEVGKMSGKQKLTNQQLPAAGLKREDNGEIDHISEKRANSKKNDNVKPRS
jgi:hypothetical protein